MNEASARASERGQSLLRDTVRPLLSAVFEAKIQYDQVPRIIEV